MRKLEKITELTAYLDTLPKRAANAYLLQSQKAFKQGGYTDKRLVKWKARKLQDKNGKQSRAVLIKTGRLVRSIRANAKGATVEISTSVPYARIHNEGGNVTGTVRVRKHQRRGRRSKKGKSKRIVVRAHSRRVNFNIPKRQFMGMSKQVNEQIIKGLEEQFKKAF